METSSAGETSASPARHPAAAVPEAPAPGRRRPVPLLRLFLIWLSLGAQSFGGGATTLAMVRRAAVEQHGWLSEEEFVRDFALVQMAPGINLLGLVTLLGRRAAGAPGIAVALAGLLLPSALITVLLSAAYVQVAGVKAVHAALKGIVPATVGISIVTSWQMARPFLKSGLREGGASLAAALLALIATAAAYVLWPGVPVVVVLVAGGAAVALQRWAGHVRAASPVAPAEAAAAEADAEAGSGLPAPPALSPQPPPPILGEGESEARP